MKTYRRLSVLLLFLMPLCITGQLSQLLIQTLKQNPSLISSLQSNPQLLKSLLLQTQQQQQIQPKPSLPRSFNQQPRRLSQEPQDQCTNLKKQNKLLRQMIFSVTGSDPADLLPEFREQPRTSGLDPTQALLNQLQGVSKPEPPKPSYSYKSVLVTPAATWTTSEMTTSYITTVTHIETSKVPILLRGQRVVTTILESDIQVVTATEIKTSSLLMTPEPTWSVQTVTITPTATQRPPLLLNTASPSTNQQPLLLPFRGGKSGSIFDPVTPANPPKKRRTNTPQRAQVVEIDQKTSPSSRNNFASAYGSFFASSAARSAKKFEDILRPTSPQKAQNVNANPLLTSFDDFDYYYDTTDFDQQLLAAQNAPIFVPPPLVKAQKSKVFTLYFSGTKPGQFTTKLTTLPVNANGQPVLAENLRKKRETDEEDAKINPSKVEPIESTIAPEFDTILVSSANAGDKSDLDHGLDSSMTSFVTVTKTVTETVKLPISSCHSQP